MHCFSKNKNGIKRWITKIVLKNPQRQCSLFTPAKQMCFALKQIMLPLLVTEHLCILKACCYFW